MGLVTHAPVPSNTVYKLKISDFSKIPNLSILLYCLKFFMSLHMSYIKIQNFHHIFVRAQCSFFQDLFTYKREIERERERSEHKQEREREFQGDSVLSVESTRLDITTPRSPPEWIPRVRCHPVP